jgi:hypothetical protein
MFKPTAIPARLISHIAPRQSVGRRVMTGLQVSFDCLTFALPNLCRRHRFLDWTRIYDACICFPQPLAPFYQLTPPNGNANPTVFSLNPPAAPYSPSAGTPKTYPNASTFPTAPHLPPLIPNETATLSETEPRLDRSSARHRLLGIRIMGQRRQRRVRRMAENVAFLALSTTIYTRHNLERKRRKTSSGN